MKALVLVQISTLDALADYYGLHAARELARLWRKAVLDFDGPVVVVDQKWAFQDPISRPRYDFVWGVELARDIRFVYDDEFESREKFYEREAEWLSSFEVTGVVLGGLWYGRGGAYGAVAEAEEFLKRYFEDVTVDPSLVAAGPEGRENIGSRLSRNRGARGPALSRSLFLGPGRSTSRRPYPAPASRQGGEIV